MKVRSVANGNIIDLPADHGLIAGGIYEPVDDAAKPAESKKPAPTPEPTMPEPAAAKPDRRKHKKASAKPVPSRKKR